ncbi:hypothetical protein EJ02DRAFT_432120 [Clathrospora elynae]|uniref:Uncharacterized protein n=1 Tax=Clathrospora elynae TaxID=706981 RepID=A0A6A5SZG8_9PLEO|nr:hypothetical protein EJ02DRAFT_432120 [Clathrospora elynae]
MLQCPGDGQIGRFTESTIYCFSDRWYNDPVLAVIQATITELKRKCLATFPPNFKVRPVNDAPPLWPTDLSPFDIKSYYFEVKETCGGEEAKWVKILPLGSVPAADTVHVYEAGKNKWVALGNWLCTAYDPNVVCASSHSRNPTPTPLKTASSAPPPSPSTQGHFIGQECLSARLTVGNTYPTGDSNTQHDVNKVLHTLGSQYGGGPVMAAVTRFAPRQEKKKREKEEEGYALSSDDFLDSDEEMGDEDLEDGDGYLEGDRDAEGDAE